MTAEVFMKHRGRDSDAAYHLVEECQYLQKATGYREMPLDRIGDRECCAKCIQLVFLREGVDTSRCDCEFHELDLDSLDGGTNAVYRCPDDGFSELVHRDVLREKAASVGLDVDDLRAADAALDTSGERGTPGHEKLADMKPDELVTDGGIERQSISDDFVVERAVPRDEATTFAHVGYDSAYHPTGGYWFPSDFVPDPDATEWVESEDEIPLGDLIQYPCDDRPPQIVGRDELPVWVKDRVVDKPMTDGERAVEVCLWERIKQFNSQFDYRDGDDLSLWHTIMKDQVEEIEEHLESGRVEKAANEFIDCVLVGQQAVLLATQFDVDDHTLDRIHDIEGRLDQVQSKYRRKHAEAEDA